MSKQKPVASLQRFLLIVLVLSVSIPAAIAGAWLIRESYHRTVDYDTNEMAVNYIELLQAGMTMPLWNIASDLGQPLIDSVSLDPSVVSIVVVDAKSNVFLSYGAEPASIQEKVIRVEREVVYETQHLGDVILSYSLEDARTEAKRESRLLFTIIVTQLVSTLVLVSYFLRRRVIQPLTDLEKASAGIAEGDLKTSIPVLKQDEFGALASQLERMRGSLESSFSHLEERVHERTIDLESVNSELQNALDQLKQTQTDLVQSEKLAALGALVAGVAHELNTPIGNGLTVASSLYEETRLFVEKIESGLTRKALDQYVVDVDHGTKLVVASLERASELVSGFKQVAADRASAQRRRFDLLAVLLETKLTVSPSFKHTNHIVDVQCDESILMDSYPGPLGQVITNLLNNARIHAFEGMDNGSIVVTAEVMPSGSDEDRVCRIQVIDNGSGIPEENQSRIFDPFFTTKLGEGGSGLGMHIVHNIVTGVLGGTIELISIMGTGTTFTIDVPLMAPKSEFGVDSSYDSAANTTLKRRKTDR